MKKREIYKNIFKYIKGYKLLFTLSVAFSVISSLAALYIPILVGSAIDGIIGKGNVNFKVVSSSAISILIVVIISACTLYLMNIINNYIAVKIVGKLRNEAFSKLNYIPLKYIDRQKSGDIVSRIISDAEQFSDGLLIGLTSLFSGSPQ